MTSVGAGPELVEDRRDRPAAAAAGPGGLGCGRARSCSRSPSSSHRMGAAGPAAAARFRDDVHAKEMLEIYERAAGSTAEPVLSRGAQGGGGAAWRS